jgi:hypothetical protein
VLEGEFGVADLVSLDNENNDSLKPAIRIVLADVLVRDVVQELGFRVVANLHHSATDLKLFVWIMEIDNGDCDAGIAPQVSDLEATLFGTNEDAVALNVNPNRRIVGGAVRHERRYMSEVGTRQQGANLRLEFHRALLGVILRRDYQPTPYQRIC